MPFHDCQDYVLTIEERAAYEFQVAAFRESELNRWQQVEDNLAAGIAPRSPIGPNAAANCRPAQGNAAE